MFWKKKPPREFQIYVADPSPIWITVSFANYGRDVMQIAHYSLRETIGMIEVAIDTKNKHYVKNYFIDDSITIDEMRVIKALLTQAVYTARAKGVDV